MFYKKRYEKLQEVHTDTRYRYMELLCETNGAALIQYKGCEPVININNERLNMKKLIMEKLTIYVTNSNIQNTYRVSEEDMLLYFKARLGHLNDDKLRGCNALFEARELFKAYIGILKSNDDSRKKRLEFLRKSDDEFFKDLGV